MMCDHLSKTLEHPIYISLRNISNWMRNKPNSKVLVGYLPKLKAKDNTTRNFEFFQKLQRQVFQRCLQILLSPILNQTDMYFVVKNEIQLLHQRYRSSLLTWQKRQYLPQHICHRPPNDLVAFA